MGANVHGLWGLNRLLQKEDLQLHKFEQAALANLCPENTDEAKTLIPRYAPVLTIRFPSTLASPPQSRSSSVCPLGNFLHVAICAHDACLGRSNPGCVLGTVPPPSFPPFISS